jgi:hypothetical protein
MRDNCIAYTCIHQWEHAYAYVLTTNVVLALSVLVVNIHQDICSLVVTSIPKTARSIPTVWIFTYKSICKLYRQPRRGVARSKSQGRLIYLSEQALLI